MQPVLQDAAGQTTYCRKYSSRSQDLQSLASDPRGWSCFLQSECQLAVCVSHFSLSYYLLIDSPQPDAAHNEAGVQIVKPFLDTCRQHRDQHYHCEPAAASRVIMCRCCGPTACALAACAAAKICLDHSLVIACLVTVCLPACLPCCRPVWRHWLGLFRLQCVSEVQQQQHCRQAAAAAATWTSGGAACSVTAEQHTAQHKGRTLAQQHVALHCSTDSARRSTAQHIKEQHSTAFSAQIPKAPNNVAHQALVTACREWYVHSTAANVSNALRLAFWLHKVCIHDGTLLASGTHKTNLLLSWCAAAAAVVVQGVRCCLHNIRVTVAGGSSTPQMTAQHAPA